MKKEAEPASGYRALVAVPDFPRIYTSLLLGRVGGQMGGVAMVLFVLARFHSPELAGAAGFLVGFPGLVLSPIAGALLDRYGRVPLIILDYLIAAVTIAMIAALALVHVLTPAWLLVIVTLSSVTGPLSAAGARSLFPILVPAHLWERANALDSSGHLVATLVGAPVAGMLVAVAGPEWALVASGGMFAVGALAMVGVRDPSVASASGHVLIDAWRGLKYVVTNATLRGIALTLSVYNMAWGALNIAVPVLVLSRLHAGPAAVGYLWGAMGVAGLIAALVAGRFDSRGRERRMMIVAVAAGVLGIAVLPFAGSLAAVAAAIVVAGLSSGPFDISVFTLRQRRTDPAWFGRVFAVSMSINSIGWPLGSALAGPLIGRSLDLALWVALACAAVAGAAVFTIPKDAGRASTA